MIGWSIDPVGEGNMLEEKESNPEKKSTKSQKKGSMTVEEAGRLGGQRVKELIEAGKKSKRQGSA